MTMTSDDAPHQGTLFFPLPDGSAIIYHLVGISRPPRPVDILTIDSKAKEGTVITLPVKNWLMTVQRFNVI